MHPKRRLAPLLIAAAGMLLLTACGGKAPAQAPTTSVSVPAAAEPEAPAPAPEPKPPTVDEWNEKALAAINDQKWQAAIDSASQAIALDGKSSAGWFNLGRGQLGAGQAKESVRSFIMAHNLLQQTPNVDVEFFLATAQQMAGRPRDALATYQRALKLWPDDPDLPRALADLQQQHDVTVLGMEDSFDLDGDGRPDQVEILGSEIRINLAAGGWAYKSEVVDLPDPKYQVAVYPLRGTTPLVDISYAGSCTTGRFHTFVWYDRAAMTTRVIEPEGNCLTYDYLGDGRFETTMALGKEDQVVTKRWADGKWVTEGTETRPRGK